MHFASGIVRPPFEADCEFLQVTSGCSHDDCKFCTFYKDARFAVSDMDEIEADLDELSLSPWRYYSRIWLQGADPFVLPYDKLMRIAELIYDKLPWVNSIGAYARATNFRNKTDQQLENLADMGYSRLSVGIESGDDDLLKRMNKGYDSTFALEQMAKVDSAGLTWVGQFINGLGGHDYGDKHALDTANFYNQLHPTMINAASLTLFEDTPLHKDVHEGSFEEASENERLEELKVLVANLECDTEFRLEHVSLPVRIRGDIPNEKDRIIEEIENAIKMNADGRLDRFRKSIVSL